MGKHAPFPPGVKMGMLTLDRGNLRLQVFVGDDGMGFVIFALQILTYVIIADAILSWIVPARDRFPRNITTRITEPLYAPIHRLLDPQKTGGIDLAPLVVIFALQALMNLLARLAL